MKKWFVSVLLSLFLVLNVSMAYGGGITITEENLQRFIHQILLGKTLTSDTSPTSDDLILTVNDPSGTPANKKVTIGNLFANISSATFKSWLKLSPTSAPGAPSVANGAAGVIPAGTYNYKCTWTRTVGSITEETALGTTSSNWTADGSTKCTITQPSNPPSDATGWKVYRSKNGPTTTWWELFVDPIAIGTTTYSDNTADAALTVEVAYEDGTYRSISSTYNRTIYLGTERGIVLGTNSIHIGEQAGASDRGYGNFFIGPLAGYSNTYGFENYFLGYSSGQDNTIGYQNFFGGAGAGRKNISGNANLYLADNAGYWNLVGNYNVNLGNGAGEYGLTDGNTNVGQSAGRENDNGIGTTNVGYQAGMKNKANKTVTVGYQAGTANVDSVGLTSVGGASLYSSIGAGNTAVGYYAGSQGGASWLPVTNGNYLTFLGYFAGLGSATQRTNSTAIGANATVDADNTVVLGDTSVVQVLMGTTPIASKGTTGGLQHLVAENTANIEADASTTITLSIPSGARLLGAQLRVDTALAAGELWDAAYSGGSTTALVSAGAVAKSTKVNKMHVDEITSDVTNIAITKNGGGSFTAQGTIWAIVYYATFITMADAP